MNLLKNGQTNHFHQFAEKSMINNEIIGSIELYKSDIETLSNDIATKSEFADKAKTPRQICELYVDTKSQLPKLTNKKRKDAERELKSIEDTYRDLHKDLPRITDIETMNKDLNYLKTDLYSAESFIKMGTDKVTNIMIENEFIEKDNDMFFLTNKGYMAANIAEVHPLVISDLCVKWNYFCTFTVKQLIGFFSCFTDVKVLDDNKSFSPNSDDYELNSYINAANESFNHYSDAENYEQTNTGIDYYEPLRYDLIDFSMEWCDCNNEEECRIFLQTRLPEKQISTGDFNKAMLKIVTVSKELSTICEDIGKIELLHKLNQIDKIVLKYVTTSQSLYL